MLLIQRHLFFIHISQCKKIIVSAQPDVLMAWADSVRPDCRVENFAYDRTSNSQVYYVCPPVPDDVDVYVEAIYQGDYTTAGTKLQAAVSGGNAPQVHNERLIRFFFPERPGALLNFMDAMRVTYNFTLFQYRYHGADFGRVLLGVEVPEERREDFEEFLTRVDRMGYPHVDETDNPAYKMFLGWHHDN